MYFNEDNLCIRAFFKHTTLDSAINLTQKNKQIQNDLQSKFKSILVYIQYLSESPDLTVYKRQTYR